MPQCSVLCASDCGSVIPGSQTAEEVVRFAGLRKDSVESYGCLFASQAMAVLA